MGRTRTPTYRVEFGKTLSNGKPVRITAFSWRPEYGTANATNLAKLVQRMMMTKTEQLNIASAQLIRQRDGSVVATYTAPLFQVINLNPKESPIFKTRFRELGIQNQGPGNWRYIDRTTGQAVGGPRRSKVEAFADLQRYAEEYGATLETNAPSRRTMARNPKVTVFAGNPSRRRTVQRQQSSRVYEIAYKHNEDGKAYKHTFKPGVCLELLSDGSIRIYSRTGKPLWRNFT